MQTNTQKATPLQDNGTATLSHETAIKSIIPDVDFITNSLHFATPDLKELAPALQSFYNFVFLNIDPEINGQITTELRIMVKVIDFFKGLNVVEHQQQTRNIYYPLLKLYNFTQKGFNEIYFSLNNILQNILVLNVKFDYDENVGAIFYYFQSLAENENENKSTTQSVPNDANNLAQIYIAECINVCYETSLKVSSLIDKLQLAKTTLPAYV